MGRETFKKKKKKGREKSTRRNEGKESSPGPVIMGVVGRTETSTERMAKTNTMNTAEAGAEDTVGMGAVSMAGIAATDTPTSVARPSTSKGSANKRSGHTDKRGRVNLAKKKEEGGKIAHTHEFLFFEFRNPPPQDGLIVRIFKNVLRLLRRQSSVRPTSGRN